MDQIKIGKFIAQKRKEQGLTQAKLAEALGITDRAVSKWETGRSLPDASLMLDLCALLGVTVNDLLCGEVVSMENKENYNEKTEKNLLELVRAKEDSDRRLLTTEIVIGLIGSLFLLTMVVVAAYVDLVPWLRIVLIVFGFAVFAVAVAFAIRIEQKAGYYRCKVCGCTHVPTYSSVLWAMHFGRTRYMKCPHCGKFSWQKKVIEEEKKD